MSAQPMEVRMAHLEGAYEQVSARLASIDDRLTSMDDRFDRRFAGMEQKFDRYFLWLAGLIVGTWTTAIFTILFHR
ncbi:MAG TPA: hypothetical protein VNG31_01315 [Candidatus Baltobacteraceae bacterium]|nr:hypothetical protein [Candidatus Baltobacteraceae bacterium]